MAAWALLLVGLVSGHVVLGGDQEIPALAEHVARVDEDVWLAGEINLESLRHWNPTHTLVIDLRTADEGTAEERVQVEALGFPYFNVPVDGAVIRDEDVAALRALLEGRDGSAAIVHCASGNRAGMLWGAMQLDDGKTLAEVLESVSPVATKDSVRAALRARAQPGVGTQTPVSP